MNPDRRLRVAIVYPFFAHYRAPVLRELLASRNNEYLLVGDIRDPSGTIPVLQFQGEPRFLRTPLVTFAGGITWQSGVTRLALRNDIDCFVFLGNAAFAATWLCALIARCRGRAVLFWTHGWIARDACLKGFFRSAFYRLAHKLLLYGERAKKIGLELGFAPNRLSVVYNSLDVAQQERLVAGITKDNSRDMRCTLFGCAETPVAIAVGRLTSLKRFDLLIDAISLLSSRPHQVNLLIVGDGPEADELRRRAAAAGIVAVFYGACYDEEELAKLFMLANVTVSPGNVGLTCMHSLGYGVPVVTHDDPAEQMPEWEAIAHGVTGSVFRKGCAVSLADAVHTWTQQSWTARESRRSCLAAVRERYHPTVQKQLIEAAIADASR